MRANFRKEKDVSARKEMAKSEFDAWNSYLEIRKFDVTNQKNIKAAMEADIDSVEQLKESALHYDHEIPEPELRKLKEFFDRSKVSRFLMFILFIGPQNPEAGRLQADYLPR